MNDTNETAWNQRADNDTQTAAEWTVLPVFQLLTALSGFLSNGVVFLVFAVNRSLWTPFNVYVVNLLIANCACIVTQFPMDIVVSLYHGGWTLSEPVCSYYLLTSWYLQPVIFNSHQLIAINRIWAVTHPISYRGIHSTRTAMCLCVGVWIYVFVGLAPGLVNDTAYYRVPLQTPGLCNLNTEAQLHWALAVQIIFYIWPQIFMLIASLVIFLVKSARRRRANRGRSNTVAPAMRGTNSNPQRTGREPTANITAATDNSETPSTPGRQRQKSSHGNLLLLLLTVSVTVCWTPNNVYYTWQFFTAYDEPTFYTVTTILFAIQTTIDPVMFALALTPLRKALYEFASCH
ncbi:hypothetical protein BV898_09271 [Hypsibius exemplaris]|uniref:G-protein coupled receptors family 1 profile domain-containing protein n=1 Tax=Hypsibius exemplaris TaxID=2072580 RepID=A0A1W0WN07_HYPEX|nr:hypothetical protein BV898_09271 [Hypsibius exemplaris]